MAGDEGPIRVKGGSICVDAYDEWDETSDHHAYKLKHKDKPFLKFWSGRLINDGVQSDQWNGRVVEIDLAINETSAPKTLLCLANGGIRVRPVEVVTIDAADGKRLQNQDVYIQSVRIRGTPAPKDFGPFTRAESKLLEIVMTAQSNK